MTTVVSDTLRQAIEALHQGELGLAEERFLEALESQPDHPQILNDLGRIYLATGRETEAIDHFHRAIQQDPSLGAAHFNMATIFRNRVEMTQALFHYEKAAELMPQLAQAQYHYALALHDFGEAAKAIGVMNHAAELSPDSFEPYARLGDWMTESGHFELAVENYQHCLQLKPDHVNAWITLGCIHEATGNSEEAIVCFRKAVAMKPNQVDLHAKLGNLFLGCRQFESAVESLDRALELYPGSDEIRLMRSHAMLALGRLESGWSDFESRRHAQFGTWSIHNLPDWQGRAGKYRTVLAYGEQGISSEIMLASCLPDLVTDVNHCVIECDPRLKSLLTRSFPLAKVVASTGRPVSLGSPEAHGADCQIAMGSLPGMYRTKFRQFPIAESYLICDPGRQHKWRMRLASLDSPGQDPTLRVGVMRCPEPENQPGDLTIQAWLRLLATPSCHWIDLQGHDDLTGEAIRQHGITLHNWNDELNTAEDLDELAALISSLDLVIAADHHIAHLAGALGVRTIVMLHEGFDWRYALDDKKSPWHPSMSVYRQTVSSSWESIFDAVRRDLVDRIMHQRIQKRGVRMRRDVA